MALPTRARSARLVVVALVSVSLLTITVDYREGNNGPLSSLGRAALTVMSPLQEVMSKVTHPIGNFFSTLVRLPAIRKENEDLKDRLAEAESKVATAAQVIASGPSNFEWTITINKGSNQGIKLDLPVVASGKRLVGHIVRVAPD